MRNTVLWFMLCVLMLLPASLRAETPSLALELPKFVLSGVPFDLKINGLGEGEASVSAKITVGETIVWEGERQPRNLQSLSLTLPASGRLQMKVAVGGSEETVSLRVIPGWFSVLPPLVAIILSLLTREVVVSLFLGVWIGALLLNNNSVIIGFMRAVDKYLLEGLADPGHAAIVIFSVSLGGMIGILNQIGGMQGIVQVISRMVVGPKSAQLAAWIMGVVIFFDDYANTLIVGNSMRPITDQNRVSREKLSYIVDSTSAPVAGIALLSTWIGYEIGLIRQAFIDLNVPETNFYGVFLQTIPFRFYCILSLFFGLVICVTHKEFGPMWAAEVRARTEGKPLSDTAKPISSPESAMPVLPESMPKRWYNAAIPIGLIIFGTLFGLTYNGGGMRNHADAAEISFARQANRQEFIVDHVQPDMALLIGETSEGEPLKLHYVPGTVVGDKTAADHETEKNLEGLSQGAKLWVTPKACSLTLSEKLRAAFADANSSSVLLWVSIAGSILALFLGLIQGLVALDKGIQAWLNGARAMMLAMVVLLLAWSINGVCKDMHTAEFIIAMVRGVLKPWLVPTVTFIVACLISFATGTSWGTMAILIPISIPLAYNLNAEYYQQAMAGQPGVMPMMEYVRQMMLVSIGAVLEGSIFGDHCSPISDTTIMSSMASGSDHIDHVKTQMPYAVSVAAVSILFCYIPAGMGYSPYPGFVVSMIALVVILEVFGKNVPDIPAEATR